MAKKKDGLYERLRDMILNGKAQFPDDDFLPSQDAPDPLDRANAKRIATAFDVDISKYQEKAGKLSSTGFLKFSEEDYERLRAKIHAMTEANYKAAMANAQLGQAAQQAGQQSGSFAGSFPPAGLSGWRNTTPNPYYNIVRTNYPRSLLELNRIVSQGRAKEAHYKLGSPQKNFFLLAYHPRLLTPEIARNQIEADTQIPKWDLALDLPPMFSLQLQEPRDENKALWISRYQNAFDPVEYSPQLIPSLNNSDFFVGSAGFGTVGDFNAFPPRYPVSDYNNLPEWMLATAGIRWHAGMMDLASPDFFEGLLAYDWFLVYRRMLETREFTAGRLTTTTDILAYRPVALYGTTNQLTDAILGRLEADMPRPPTEPVSAFDAIWG